MSQIADEFGEQIADHFEDPYHQGTCEQYTHFAEGAAELCDDRLTVSLRCQRGTGDVEEAWFDGQACPVCLAAASMLMEHIEGMSWESLEEFGAQEMLEMFEPSLPIHRQKCGMLPWRVLRLAMESPMDEDSDDEGPSFGGPHLGEEN